MFSKYTGIKMTAPIASTIALARKVVNASLCNHSTANTEKNKQALAKAYYTLSQKPGLSISKSRLHLNSCIKILRQVNKRSSTWALDLASAYQKRGEALEEEGKLDNALIDYKKAIKVLAKLKKNSTEVYALLAECNLSIADILIFNSDNNPENLNSSYSYANKAIQCLLKANNFNSELLSCLIYAHQTAGIAASETNFGKALSNFKTALSIIYNSNLSDSVEQVAETYRYLSIIYTLKSINENFYPLASIYENASTVYNNLNVLLSAVGVEDIDIESLEELTVAIAKILANPFVNLSTVQDLTDNLIFVNKHFSSNSDFDLGSNQFHYTDGENVFVEPLPKLFTKIVSNLLSCAFRLSQNTVEKSFSSIYSQKFNFYKIAMDYYDSKPCRVYAFEPKRSECSV